MANRPISIDEANAMIQQYLVYMKNHGVDTAKQTQSVSFTGPELMAWLQEVMPYADELRVCEGVYPPGHPQAGRITTILWPYKDGYPAKRLDGKGNGGGDGIKPFNEGQGHP
jgi:hypothetical protein